MSKIPLYLSNFILFMFLLFLFINCQGCYHPTPVLTSPTFFISTNSDYSYEVDRTIQAWNTQEGLEEFYVEDYGYNADATIPATCNKNLLKFAFVNDVEFISLSTVCALPPEGYSCQEYWNSPTTATDSSSPLTFHCPRGCAYAFYHRAFQTIYISDRVQTYSDAKNIILSLIRHESIHWLSSCSGHEHSDPNGTYENSDAAHADPRLWGNNSVITRSAVLFF